MLSDIAIATSVLVVIAGFAAAAWMVFAICDAIRNAPKPLSRDHEAADNPETRARRNAE